jgi:hypothetical protein
MGGVAFESRDLGNDRGNRVVAGLEWAMRNLNPHPFRNRKGAAPKSRLDRRSLLPAQRSGGVQRGALKIWGAV